MVGLGGLEPPTSPLSGVRSSHLSYRPTERTATLRSINDRRRAHVGSSVTMFVFARFSFVWIRGDTMVNKYSRILRLMVCTGLSLIFVLSASSTDLATLSGTIVDPMNAVIPNSHIIIHWDSAGLDGVKDNVGIKDDKFLATDQAGHFSLELPPVRCLCDGERYSPHCEKLAPQTGKLHPYRSEE